MSVASCRCHPTAFELIVMGNKNRYKWNWYFYYAFPYIWQIGYTVVEWECKPSLVASRQKLKASQKKVWQPTSAGSQWQQAIKPFFLHVPCSLFPILAPAKASKRRSMLPTRGMLPRTGLVMRNFLEHDWKPMTSDSYIPTCIWREGAGVVMTAVKLISLAKEKMWRRIA